MHSSQQQHIAQVMRLSSGGSPVVGTDGHDSIIRHSWTRCVQQHQLDPTRMQEAIILPHARLRERQDQMEAFLQIARHGMEALYQQVAGMGYVVLLTDARGITVDFIGDLQYDQSMRKAGLCLGADWSESVAGTCGVGTCISTGEALTVHQGDHFDATHIPLTCTTAPVFDALGQLTAVLDISALRSPLPKDSQHLALQLVKVYAQHVENASFLQRFRHDWILRLSAAPPFLDANPEYLLALDAGGRIIGHNRRAQLLLQPLHADPVLGQRFDRIFDLDFNHLGRFVQGRPSDQRAVALAGSARWLFLLAAPPPARWCSVPHTAPYPAPENPLPAPLACLSGGDPVLDRQIGRAARLLNSPVSMLLTGETGTGKEVLAKALHASSARRGRPFVAVNCAAIPETLIESELFGYLPGSFTGAGRKAKRGLIQEADGGTLFLDEIGDMPRPLQARLLRVLSEREVLPIGAIRPVPVNLRVIAATHCDLEVLVREGRFRDDLYYRLNGAHIRLPALRERQDLGWMLGQMLQATADGAAVPVLAPDARAWLLAYRWPGNLRELHNVVEYARSVCRQGRITLADLPDRLGGNPDPHAALAPTAGDEDAAALARQLRAAGWNVTAVARQLKVSRMTVYRRMQRWDIRSPNHMDETEPAG